MEQKYNFDNYIPPARWASYWYQIKEVLALSPGSVLEIGVGNKTVFTYLKGQGINAVSLDTDESLKPDTVADVLHIPFEDNSFDAVLCAEVLEHLPFESFEKAVKEIRRVTKKHLVLSLPHFGPQIKFSFKIPLFSEKKISFKIPIPVAHKFSGKHYWEIGKRGYSTSTIRSVLKKYFKIKKEFIPFENQYHHFFILEKF